MNDANVAAFRALHHGSDVLLLPNAWDAASARLFGDAGARAIATTSAGVAWSWGYPDGDVVPADSILTTVRAIRQAVRVPLSADVEGGYSAQPQAVAALVMELAGAGAAGINLEDGEDEPELLAAKIAAVKDLAKERGADVFINARCDVYLRELAQGPQAVAETIARGRRYAAAGADGFFVPAVSRPDEILAISTAVALPLNVLAVPALPHATGLYDLGVRRVSAGASLARLAFGTAREAAIAFLRDGNVPAFYAHPALEYAAMNASLQK